jgi:hypothetical protein
VDSKLIVAGPGCGAGECEVDAERDLPGFDACKLMIAVDDNFQPAVARFLIVFRPM